MIPIRALSALAIVALLPFSSGQESADGEPSRARWNEVFLRGKERGVHMSASRFLGEVIAELPAGTALDVGMGEGRNAVFLAQQGWSVTGFDLSDVAVEQARESASRNGAPLVAEVGDVSTYDYGQERWDLITVFFMHELILPRAADLMAALKPGGLLVVEGFHRDLGEVGIEGGPYGYHTNELPRVFDDLRILRYEDRVDVADWSRKQRKPLVRLVARKEAVPAK